jgi:Tn3 transposase DDE domain/Domain of unknown function (DUF4158)
MPRMKILNSVEREVFDWPPIFNSVERKRCFDFPTPLQDIATSLRTAGNQLVFLLSCGYFKATKRFYPVPTFHLRDLTYVADRIAVALEGIDLTDYPKQTMARHQATILNFYGFRALSAIEHVHAFTRAVSIGNPREFLQAEKEDQEMAEACKLLIKNCIICWNYLYLSQKLAEIDDPAKRKELLQAMAHGSAAAWGHLNLLGEYDFSEDKLQDSVGIKPPKLTD